MENKTKCIDFGSEYCPCHLAEFGQCSVCNMVNGQNFCDCHGQESFCVLAELKRNNGRAQALRKKIRCLITDVKIIKNIILLKISLPVNMLIQLKKTGSFIFINRTDNPFFDFPISVYDIQRSDSTVSLIIVARGIKSRSFLQIKSGDEIYVRGPYFNGLYGIADIQREKNGKCLIISQGIGLLSSSSLLNFLKEQDNQLDIIYDRNNLDEKIVDFTLSQLNILVHEISLLDSEHKLSETAKEYIQKSLAWGTDFIHLGASNYLAKLIISFLKEIKRTDIKLSCFNNARMSCGEGICGSCTNSAYNGITPHKCKEQVDIWEL